MKKLLLLILLAFSGLSHLLADDDKVINPYTAAFTQAYEAYPDIPRGMLEAVAFNNTRFTHLTHTSIEPESCMGIPNVYGVMGLTLDGKQYFRNNLELVSELSSISIEDIIKNPSSNILAFAKAYSALSVKMGTGSGVEEQKAVLIALSEIPDDDIQNDFALNSQLYVIYTFLNNQEYQTLYHFPEYDIDLSALFGIENYKVLSSTFITINESEIKNKSGDHYLKSPSGLMSTDYGPAIWNPTTCNYSSRSGTAISAVAIHDMEGSYAGAISWFKNCGSSVSAHYCLRSSDGQVTQMVREYNKAWHIGSANPYTIGLEHEGYAASASWYTTAMYNSSALLVINICGSGYGISPKRCWDGPSCSGSSSSCELSSCIKIKGHQHFPAQTHTDPGPNWNWKLYYNLINPSPPTTTFTTCSGTIYDSGGSGSNYSNDERYVKVINPAGSGSVTMTFTSFNTQYGVDYLYIYNGTSISAPLIGKYSGTTGPGTINASSGAITLEFRSSCATTASGWAATWSCSSTLTSPTSLAATTPTCASNVSNYSWVNSGASWVLQVSASATFATYSSKAIASVTSTTGSAGFSPAFTYLSSTTYYWRIYNGSTYTSGPSFTTPVCDITPPTTAASVTGTWQTANFTANFTDLDNAGGSGVNKKFYQIQDYNGTEWRANKTLGFFNDNFSTAAIHADWLGPVGTWAISTGYLRQSDETVSNSKITTAVTQSSTLKYLYEWRANMQGTGTNRRCGLHFMASSSTLPNRGDSYLVWFKLDAGTLEIQKGVADILTIKKTVALSSAASTWYTYKVTYDPATGKIDVYRNDILITSWTDTAPITTGSFVSFRNGNSNVYFDDMSVYHSRTTGSAPATIGSSTVDVRYQNPNPTTPSCKIRSVVTDNFLNISATASVSTNIDWTVPATITSVKDGTSADIDTSYNSTQLASNWTSTTDANSGIVKYWYAIGTTLGATNVIAWTNNGTATSVTHTGLALTIGQQYFFTVKAEDGAGLMSVPTNSNGQYVMNAAPPDPIAPSTTMVTIPSSLWQTQDFNLSFTDADNTGGSGIFDRYYQVLDYDGTNWSGNTANGFLTDNFSTLIPSWAIPAASGSWSIISAALNQSDESINNTNIYTPIAQAGSSYLYHFKAAVGGTTSVNRRFGIHFFSSNASLPNRGDSYLVWIRPDQAKIEFQKGLSDVLTIKKTTLITTNVNQVYDYKIFYNPATGTISVYRDNMFIDSYTDPVPLTAGGEVSFRTGNSNSTVDDFNVYRSRTASAIVSIGSAAADVRYQNPDPLTPSCNINSLSRDVAGNISAIYSSFSNIDWTSPSVVSTINDGTATDIDTVITPGQLSANWSASTDPHSALDSYLYAIGDTPGDSNIVAWTNNGTSATVTSTGLTLLNTSTYYYSVKSLDGAGLYSAATVSNGQTFLAAPFINFGSDITTGCAGDFVQFTDSSSNVSSWLWLCPGGYPDTSYTQNPIITYSPGTYNVTLVGTGPGGTDSLIRTSYIVINPKPQALFSTTDTMIYLPSAIATFNNGSLDATSYLWNFGDGTTATSVSPSHFYTSTGTYVVTLIAVNGLCDNDTLVMTNYVTVLNASGINEMTNDPFGTLIFPNPFSNTFTVTLNISDKNLFSVKLKNVLGQAVWAVDENTLHTGQNTINVNAGGENISGGIYFLEISDGTHYITHKVIAK